MADITIEQRDPRVTLGDLLKRARLDAGYEQAELAEKIGSSRSAIGAWERDRNQPDFEWVKRIIEACDAPWLLTEPFRSSIKTRSRWCDETAGHVLAEAVA